MLSVVPLSSLSSVFRAICSFSFFFVLFFVSVLSHSPYGLLISVFPLCQCPIFNRAMASGRSLIEVRALLKQCRFVSSLDEVIRRMKGREI